MLFSKQIYGFLRTIQKENIMINGILDMFKDIVNMSVEEKKNRLVEIKKNQLNREKEKLSKKSITASEEIEAIAILETLIPISSGEDIRVTLKKMGDLREEINRRAMITDK